VHDSIEEKIIDLQDKKKHIRDQIIDGKESESEAVGVMDLIGLMY